jgi:type I pantothenate kinase
VPDRRLTVERPDILIVEGLNVLQPALPGTDGRTRLAVADYFDFSIYVDATEEDLQEWYIERLLLLRETSLHDPRSYFNFLTTYDEAATREFARQIWESVNLVNLRENIAPTRGRAHLVLEKGTDHAVRRVRLRKV